MKKFLPMLLVLMFLMSPMEAFGAVTAKVSTGTIQVPMSYQLIESGQSQLVDCGNRTININGETTTYNPVSQIGLILHLQYLSNGSWYTLQTYNYTAYSKSYISRGQRIVVTPGYYYRVAAEHTAYDGYINETGYSYTETVYIP